MSPLKVCVISAGRMAGSIDDEIESQDTWPSLKAQLPYCHAGAYAQTEGVRMVAVCDLDEDKCHAFRQRWDVPRHYTDYREMIVAERPDIVSVATAASMHAEMAVFAMDHGVRGIYCEKAMCCSLAEADAIVAAVQRSGARFQLGAMRRHHPLLRAARAWIAGGELGELVAVNSWISSALLHSLSHCVDTALFLAGDVAPSWVSGLLGQVGAVDDVEGRRAQAGAVFDEASGRWSGDPGCLGYTARLADGVLLQHLPAVTDLRFEAVCTDGHVRVESNTDRLSVHRRRGTSYSFDPVELPPASPASGTLALVRDLVDCVRTGGTPSANEGVARHGMEILIGAAQSHLAEGRRLVLPLARRDVYIPSH